MKRKTFINRTLMAIGGLSMIPKIKANPPAYSRTLVSKPIVISTWSHGMAANEAAWEVLMKGGRALDAVERGVRVSELDPEGSPELAMEDPPTGKVKLHWMPAL